jgi:putative transposase
MVVDPRDYLWSSHRCNAYGHGDSLVSPHPSYLELGDSSCERQRSYLTLFHEPLSEKMLARIREDTNQGWPIGDDAFRNEVEMRLGRRAQRLPRGWVKGRPRGSRGDATGGSNKSG